MTDALDPVRDALNAPEDVDMGDVPTAAEREAAAQVGGGGDIPPDPPADMPPPPDRGHEDRVFLASEQPLNDYGNGQRLVIHFGNDLMFVPRVGWFVWSGKHWQKDPDQLMVRARAQKIHELIGEEVAFIKPTKREAALLEELRGIKARILEIEDMPAGEKTDAIMAEMRSCDARARQIDGIVKSHQSAVSRRLTHAKNAGNNGPIGHMMTESTTSLSRPFEDLNANPLQVNTAAGLITFTVTPTPGERQGRLATYEVLPHHRDQLQTKLIDINPRTPCDPVVWRAFLERIQPDRDMRSFLQRWLGLSVLGVKAPYMAFWHGSGANGKSVLADIVARILDGYAATMRVESITGTNRRSGAEATPDLIPLLAATFVRTSEPEQNEKLQEGMVKALTGGEPISVRPNYGEQIEIEPLFKITMSGNHKPEIRGTDDGIWRRVLLVPFDVQIPLEERDERLGEKLWVERAGILDWLIEGALEYLEIGLDPPKVVREATAEYREESDPIGMFLMNACDVTGDPDDSVLAKRLTDAFGYYLMERGASAWKPSTFQRQISVKAKQWKHPETGNQFTKGKNSLSQYIGIKLDDAFERRLNDAPRGQNGAIIDVARPVSPATPDPDLDF